MSTYLVTIGVLLAIVLGGIFVDHAYRRFAQRHPELGPFRKSGGGCGCCSGESGCSGSSCASSSGKD